MIFTGIFIPDGLVQAPGISAGAKLAYGRLVRYAGQDGDCHPAVPTLASEIGVSVRQTQYYLSELERDGLLRRLERLSAAGQSSNAYQFLWHPLLEVGMKKTAPEGVKDIAPRRVKDSSPKESHSEESHSEEKSDLDYPPTNRKERDSRLGSSSPAQTCKEYPRLCEALAEYMMGSPDDEKIYPTPRHVVDVMDAAGGASEDEVLHCLLYLRDERRLKPRTRSGPRHFSWFPTVVRDYFRRQCGHRQDISPAGGPDLNFTQAQFDSMTAAIEI